MSRVLFANGLALLWREGCFVAERVDVLVQDDKIADIAEHIPTEGCEVVDMTGKLLMPGLVNMHTHAYMSLLRNAADDMPFNEWLNEGVMPKEDRLTAEDATVGVRLSMAEMIRTGTTCFVDMHMFPTVTPSCAQQAGMRAVVGRGLVGEDYLTDARSRVEQAVQEMDIYRHSALLTFVLSPHALYSCSSTMLKSVGQLAREMGVGIHTHLAESDFEQEYCLRKYGCTPTAHLDRCGLFDVPYALVAHAVHLDDADRTILAQKGVSVAINPASNLKLGNGSADVVAMLQAGVNVCLGTDSAASNNALNMFGEMRLLALVQKGLYRRADVMSAQDVLAMATVNAGKTLKQNIGQIAQGWQADLIAVDLQRANMAPHNDVVTSLVYSAMGNEVCHNMVAGQWLMKEGVLTTLDEAALVAQAEQIRQHYQW